MKPTSRSHPNRFSKKGRFFLSGLLCLLLFAPLLTGCHFVSSKTIIMDIPADSEVSAEPGALQMKLKKIHSVDTPVESANEAVMGYAWDNTDPTRLLLLKATDKKAIRVLRMDYRYGFYDEIFTYTSPTMLYASLSPGGQYLVYAEYPSGDATAKSSGDSLPEGDSEISSEKEIRFTLCDLTNGEQKTFSMKGMVPSEWRNKIDPDAASVAYSDMFGCWSNDGGALAVWALPGNYVQDAVVSVITFSDMQSRSCLVPLLGYVSAVNEEGTALIAAQYSDPEAKEGPNYFYYCLSEQEEGSYELLRRVDEKNEWFAFDPQGGILYHLGDTLRRCTFDDVKSHIGEYSWESDASYYNGKFNESLSPVILHDNISLHNSSLAVTEQGEAYVAFATDYCDIYVARLQDNRLINPQLLYKGDYGSFRITLSRDASRLLIEETTGHGVLSKKYPLVLELE